MQPFLETISIRHEPEIPVGVSLPQVLQQVFLDRCFDLRLLSDACSGYFYRQARRKLEEYFSSAPPPQV
jgi:hypothetical protein